MKSLIFAWVASLVFAAANSSYGSQDLRGPVPLPSFEDFYQPPYDLDKYKPGEIIKIREVPRTLRSVYFKVNIKRAWNLMIRTTNNAGNGPTWVVTTLMEPFNADPKKLVSYSIAEDSSDSNCAPSYALQFGASMSTISSQAEMLLISGLLDKGYYVNTPDYEGESSSFAIAHQAGYSSLDSIRGVLSSGKTTGLHSDAKFVTWGYSGGSLPASWTAALQPTYAPELSDNFVGATFGGLLANLTAAAETLDDGIFAGFVAMVIAGLPKHYPYVEEVIKKQLDNNTYQVFQTKGNGLCMVPGLFEFMFESIFTGSSKWTKDGWAIFDDPKMKEIMRENTLALPNATLPKVPIFLYHGYWDEILPYRESQRVYDTWCNEGIESLEFVTDMTAEHIIGVVSGVSGAYKFIDDRLNGVPPVKGCKKRTLVSNFFYPNATYGLWQVAKTSFKAMWGTPLGPQS